MAFSPSLPLHDHHLFQVLSPTVAASDSSRFRCNIFLLEWSTSNISSVRDLLSAYMGFVDYKRNIE